jgi:hypothetical protein
MQFDIFIIDYNTNQPVKIAHSSSLRTLLRVGKIQKHPQPLDEILLQHCGVHKQHDWPLGALDAISSGVEARNEDPVAQYWRAVPVSLSLLRDSFALEQKVELTADEMKDLTVLFCQFFAQDGLHFSLNQHGGWLVQHQKKWVLETHHLQQVLGKNIAQFQATGQDANKLRSLQNQLQMLLHNHPVNVAREAAGLPICNSLWLYGGAKLPVEVSSTIDYFAGESALVKSLATISNKPVLNMLQLEIQLASTPKNHHAKTVIVLESDAEIDQLNDVLTIIKLNKIKQLNIHLNINDEMYCLRYQPQYAWKFWRRAKPFESYFV